MAAVNGFEKASHDRWGVRSEDAALRLLLPPEVMWPQLRLFQELHLGSRAR